MNKYFFYSVFAVAIIAVIAIQFNQIRKLSLERDQHQRNSQALLQDVQQYKIKDSLNVAQAGILELKLKDFEKYREEDAELIKSLQTKNKDLDAVNKLQLQTINSFKVPIKDSIIYINNNIRDTIKCIEITQKWFDFSGCIEKGIFSGKIINREELTIVATLERKKFLGFLWKTNKIKDKKVDAFSKNPNTIINNIEYIEIIK